MNIQKLASLAGVSPGTVSKAFSGSTEISEKTKNIIFEIAKQNNCFEKYNKLKYSKKVVAVICPEVKSEYYCSMVSYIEKQLCKQGVMMVLSISEFSAQKEEELISYHLSCKNADGIIIIESSSDIKYNKDIPIIVINSIKETHDVDCINTDFYSAIVDAVALLKQKGHTDIAYIGEELAKDKQEFFEKAMRVQRLPIKKEFIFEEKERFESAGYKAMERIYKLSSRPTAILAAYDYIALGAIQCIRDHGENVPDNYSIIGIDDISFASHRNVNLTSIKSNIEEICNMALELLMKKINVKSFSLRQHISVRGELINRSSVKDIRI